MAQIQEDGSDYHMQDIEVDESSPPTEYLYGYLCHSPSQAYDALHHWITQEQLTDRQRKVIPYWQFLRQNTSPDPEGFGVLLAYSYIFRDMFFFGVHSIRYRIEIVDHIPDSHGRTVGLCYLPDPTRAFCVIQILNRSNEAALRDPVVRMTSYLSTLLHEMIHGFFELLLCNECLECKRLVRAGVGRSGHGPHWEAARCLIESVTLEFLGEHLRIT